MPTEEIEMAYPAYPPVSYTIRIGQERRMTAYNIIKTCEKKTKFL